MSKAASNATSKTEPREPTPKPAPRPTAQKVPDARQSIGKPSGGMGSGVTGFVTMVTLAAAAGLIVLHPTPFSALTNGAAKILTTLVRGK